MELTLSIAFIAGLISFVSPCVLPLVPAYIGYMGGRMTNTLAQASGQQPRALTLLHSLFFIGGFTLVFVGLGLMSTAFVRVIGGQNISTVTDLIGRIGGILIIFFGLHFMGVLPRWLRQLHNNQTLLASPWPSLSLTVVGTALILWAFSGNVLIWDSTLWEYTQWAPLSGLLILGVFIIWLFVGGAFTDSLYFWRNTINRITTLLYADTRINVQQTRGNGLLSSALMGIVFAAGWTPCIGPVYGAVLTLAANGGDIPHATSLLTAYSLGLGVPFFLTAFALEGVQAVIRRIQHHMHKIELVSGAFLVFIGVMVASGQLQKLSAALSVGEFAESAIALEEQVLDSLSNVTLDTPATPTPPEATPVAMRPASITGLAQQAQQAVIGLQPGDIAPNFETTTVTGQPIMLSDFRGEIVLLNFWATWCGPCRVEMPEFEAIYNEYKTDGFNIIAINNAESRAYVQTFQQEFGLNFNLAMDEQAVIQRQYNISGYPSSLLINRQGIIISQHFGPLSADQLREMLADALAA